MDVREKLIEILRKPIFPHELVDPTEAVADYLLDSGVTVQEWIPVKDRLASGLKRRSNPLQLLLCFCLHERTQNGFMNGACHMARLNFCVGG